MRMRWFEAASWTVCGVCFHAWAWHVYHDAPFAQCAPLLITAAVWFVPSLFMTVFRVMP